MKDEEVKQPISTEPYKGVRDFYPEDMFIQNHIFGTMRSAVESFGFVEYGASILEPTELYKAKSGEEIVNDQTYSFKDRGDRDVTLRPEMTPTITRMIAAKRRELSSPIRWYSIPNLFRYEKPQRGRLREHFQLNVDLFGVENINAEIEVISIAAAIMKKFGARDDHYIIRINNRKILNYLLKEVLHLDEAHAYKAMKLIDKKDKMSKDEFKNQADEIIGTQSSVFISLLNATSIADFKDRAMNEASSDIMGVEEITTLLKTLKKLGIHNAVFDPTLARGFDYYTGIVFEVFDTDPRNARSLFGGGRFDDLLSVFGTDKLPAVGFGMGDVGINNFLETHELLPKYSPKTHLVICTIGQGIDNAAFEFAAHLRALGANVAIDATDRKAGQKIQAADKQSIPYLTFIGEKELASKTFTIKELATSGETVCSSEQDIIEFIKK
jgi:histidyl-tRNA synthetase